MYLKFHFVYSENLLFFCWLWLWVLPSFRIFAAIYFLRTMKWTQNWIQFLIFQIDWFKNEIYIPGKTCIWFLFRSIFISQPSLSRLTVTLLLYYQSLSIVNKETSSNLHIRYYVFVFLLLVLPVRLPKWIKLLQQLKKILVIFTNISAIFLNPGLNS